MHRMNVPNPKVLLVSSDRAALRQLSRFLELFGYAVLQAADPPLALAALEAEQPDLVVVDDDLGGADGLELLRTARKVDWPGRFLYTLLMTSEPEAERFVQALEAGTDDFLAKPIVYGELLARLRTAARVIEAERRSAAEAHIDPLTALPSHASLMAQLEARRSEGVDPDHPLSCIVIDLDFLKRFNHRHGHLAGDRLLQAAARKLEKLCHNGELAARLERGRFAVLLPNTSDVRAAAWAERARRAFSHLELPDADDPKGVTASFGVAGTSETSGTSQRLVARATQALELAKRSGRNCVVRDGEFNAEAAQWQQLAAPGRLFEGTVARDVMIPCAVVLQHDGDAGRAAELLARGGLPSAPVVDADGRLAGIFHGDDLRSRPRPTTLRVADVLQADPPTFSENDTFKSLFDFFVEGSSAEAVVVRDGVPVGTMTRAGLAALIEVPVAGHEETPPDAACDDQQAACLIG